MYERTKGTDVCVFVCIENLLKGSVATEQDSRLNLTWSSVADHGRTSAVKFAGDIEQECAVEHQNHHGNADDNEDVSTLLFAWFCLHLNIE